MDYTEWSIDYHTWIFFINVVIIVPSVNWARVITDICLFTKSFFGDVWRNAHPSYMSIWNSGAARTMDVCWINCLVQFWIRIRVWNFSKKRGCHSHRRDLWSRESMISIFIWVRPRVHRFWGFEYHEALPSSSYERLEHIDRVCRMALILFHFSSNFWLIWITRKCLKKIWRLISSRYCQWIHLFHEASATNICGWLENMTPYFFWWFILSKLV